MKPVDIIWFCECIVRSPEESDRHVRSYLIEFEVWWERLPVYFYILILRAVIELLELTSSVDLKEMEQYV